MFDFLSFFYIITCLIRFSLYWICSNVNNEAHHWPWIYLSIVAQQKAAYVRCVSHRYIAHINIVCKCAVLQIDILYYDLIIELRNAKCEMQNVNQCIHWLLYFYFCFNVFVNRTIYVSHTTPFDHAIQFVALKQINPNNVPLINVFVCVCG